MYQGRTIHHRIFATLLSLGILALLVSTASLALNSVTRSPSQSASSTLPKLSKPFDLTSVLSSYLNSHGHFSKAELLTLERPYITFIGDTLSPSDNRLTGTLEVVIPPGVPPFMASKGQQMFTCPGSGSCQPQAAYAGDVVTATMLVTNAGTNYELQKTVKLKNLYTNSVLGLHEFPVDMPIRGFSGSYPQDKYSADVSLALSFPSTTQFLHGRRQQVRTVTAGIIGNTYAASTHPTPGRYQKLVSNVNDTFSLTIARNWYNQFFVYTVALIPVLFALLFLHLLFFSGGGYGVGRSFEHFTEALVVSVLSVLPLRVVLVPGDISGLTRVDLTLAVGLVLIVAVAAGKYAREIWSGSQPEERDLGHGFHSAVELHPDSNAGTEHNVPPPQAPT